LRGQQADNSKAPIQQLNNQTIQTIPVSLRVLDFELPKPMAYRQPDREFYVASYNYSSPSHIAQWNGGEGTEWTLIEEVLKDQVRHGQTIHWMFGLQAGANVTERTIDVMKRAGMRTDVFVGGLSFFGDWHTADPNMRARQAARGTV